MKNTLVKSALVASAMEWDNRSWGLMEQLRFVLMILLWIAAWLARAMFVFLPQQLQSSSSSSAGGGLLGMIDTIVSTSILSPSEDDVAASGSNLCLARGGGLAKSAIGRALSQVLELVNDIPASSRKYEFARSLADKILDDNTQHGAQALKEVNRMALETSFLRTVYLLEASLGRQQQQEESWGWTWRLLAGVPLGAASLGCHFIPILGTVRSKMQQLQCMQLLPAAVGVAAPSDKDEFGMAEKLSQELLWIAQRLKDNYALDAAILHWSSSASLANQSLNATARVQKILVKLSAFLYAGLVSSEAEPAAEVTLRMLVLWLPLLCRSTQGMDGQLLSSSEKQEAERVLEKTIHLLPDADQELVLGLWLREYALSNSDWPNLQACYNSWCYSTRKLSCCC